jgi:hypothetical protein
MCHVIFHVYGVSHEGKYCTFNKILVRKAQISVESYLVYFITLNDIDNLIKIKSHEN